MQDPAVVEVEFMRKFRNRRREQGPIFWTEENILAVFDAQVAQRLEAANFADLTLLDGWSDALRGRPSEPVTWNQLRSGWSGQMRMLTSADGLQRLARRMEQLLDAESGRQQDLVWLAERVSIESLVPAIIGGLKPAANRRVIREVLSKVAYVLSDIDTHRNPRWHEVTMAVNQLLAGIEVRRELKGRASGKRARQQDLTDSVVELIPTLGIGRAVDAVTSLLTAITGSPGAAAACLCYELNRQHEWRARLEAELGAISVEQLCESPMRLAPMTGRFVKEVLRIWGPPIIVRRARTDIDQDQVTLKTGQEYAISPFLVHHDDSTWSDPESFDPERWLANDRRGQCPHGSYVPFGWAPKSCLGANLGMAQLVLLVHLLCTRYRLQETEPGRARMAVASVVRPMDFEGAVLRRPQREFA